VPVRVVRPCRLVLALVLAVVVALIATPAQAAHKARHHAHKAAAPAARVSSAACSDANLIPASANLDRVAAATLCLVNQERATAGLGALRPDAALAGAAARHAQDMVARNFFDHVNPSGADPLARIRRSGYVRPGAGFTVGENIAAAGGSLATPAAMVKMWMGSPGHRANILDPAYRDTGIGVAPAAPAVLTTGPGATYTEDFGATS
jgi:uncharacterized protein YkwD